jgi:hypothetical protein
MNKLGIAVAAILSLSMVALAVYSWISLSDIEMDTGGLIALVLGGIATLGLGAGLMGLMFYSNRKGFDEDAGAPLSRDHREPR